ncbi:ATP-binding protein [Kiloniella laminariae]|uniref:histidine kinase n=1 Tax=Kiloniella laminariae TaxID=454162 RepID=A0ABT4LKG7_9PROT|nr:ATP-binding protein [Kiloniella laminariae]MCZ4281567.1 ATP-binding protein [Kiloniella laminariae]
MDHYRRLIYGIFFQILLLVGLLITIVFTVLFYSANQQDEITRQDYIRLVKASLQKDLTSHKRLTYDYSYWEDSYSKLIINLDPAWAKKNIGEYLEQTFEISGSLVLDTQGKKTFESIGLQNTPAFATPAFSKKLNDIFHQATNSSEDENQISDFIELENQLYMVSLNLVTSDTREIDFDNPETPRGYLMLLKEIDLSPESDLVTFLGLQDLHFTADPQNIITNGFTMEDARGQVIGILDWHLDLPGTILLRKSLYWTAGALVLAIILCILIFRRGNSVLGIFSRDHERQQLLKLRNEQQINALKSLVQNNIFYQNNDDRALMEVTKTVCLTLRSDRASIWFLNQEEQQLECHNVYEAENDRHSSPPTAIPFAGCEDYYQRMQKKRILAQDDCLSNSKVTGFLDLYLKVYNIQSILDAGLFQNNELIGIISVERTRKTYSWPLEEISFVASVTHLLSLLFEIRERREIETHLISAKEEAEAANQAKSEFLANMSHELRTPLNAIIGFSDLMRNEMFGPIGQQQYKGYSEDIYNSGTHLLSLISDILDISKIEAGGYLLEMEKINFAEVAASAIRMLAPRAENRSLQVETEIPESLSLITADHRALLQILLNIIANAIKFSHTGSRVLFKAVETTNRELKITVTDFGLGIPDHQLPLVGSPFYQGESTLRKKHEGTGLGLYITKSLVTLHHGTFRIDSKFGEGTTVTITLPLQLPSPSHEGLQGVESDYSDDHSSKRPNVTTPF